jgi:GNAT superfamily N-acetyltransferase
MSRPSFAIRKAVPRDAEAMFAVHQASVHALCAKAYSAEHMASWFEGRTPEIYTPALAAEQIWVAEQDGSIVGFVGARPGEVTLLFVLPQAAGQGIGSGLFERSGSSGSSGVPGRCAIPWSRCFAKAALKLRRTQTERRRPYPARRETDNTPVSI